MKRSFFPCLTAAALSVALVTTPVAQALTPEQAAQLIQELYVDDVSPYVLEQPTVQEMVAALGDPYTEYFTAEEYAAFNASIADTTLVGIGVVMTQAEEGYLLERVIPDSPAQKAGLQAGDILTAVDGASLSGLDIDEASALIRGEEGSAVRVSYLQDGRERTVKLIRASVVVPTATTELIDGHIGYIDCTAFGPETAQHFREGIEAYRDQATVWIVDLRSNTGGSTDAATEAAGYFTGAGEIAYLRNGKDHYEAYYHEDRSLTLDPVIVLVDYYSASASELFASAIRDHGAGIVVGTRSFGKGVAQSVLDQQFLPEYFPDGDAIKITSHRFFSPDGNTTDQVGVIPDLLVDPDTIGDVAYLLAGASPTSDTSNTLRIDLDWRWFVDLNTASSQEHREAFRALLQAIPASKNIWLGTGGSTGWQKLDAQDVAAQFGLDYEAPIFPDQDDSDFQAPLSVLKTYDMLHGRDDGLFHPQDTLTRAELCQMLAVALNCTVPSNASPYEDVSDDAWYAPAVIAMTNMGLVNGMGEGKFSPEDTVDHQQFITIMGRMAQWANMYLYNTVQNAEVDPQNVVGLTEYADWAKESAWLLSYSQTGYFGNTLSLLWDSAHNIVPTQATTRDEAAYTLYRLLSYTGILPA